ncbi:hypothetical protein EFW17_22350 [Halostreptopolyspora alba]|uniref:Uncharacterized protein n=1 Tax=Halostreptopolyspora alba TaxID=2487137 RepID=A0A3N0DYX2_9ACTN|nr:hypothetical protein EFW17_22350 [Nocardiopsaceae bacterium YIM 96095]
MAGHWLGHCGLALRDMVVQLAGWRAGEVRSWPAAEWFRTAVTSEPRGDILRYSADVALGWAKHDN